MRQIDPGRLHETNKTVEPLNSNERECELARSRFLPDSPNNEQKRSHAVPPAPMHGAATGRDRKRADSTHEYRFGANCGRNSNVRASSAYLPLSSLQIRPRDGGLSLLREGA
jgi:hypothetical protein